MSRKSKALPPAAPRSGRQEGGSVEDRPSTDPFEREETALGALQQDELLPLESDGDEAEQGEALLAIAPATLPLESEEDEGGAEPALSRTDPLARYMQEVNRHPVLSREEEHALAVRYARTGDLDAAYRLVISNLRLVVKIAYEYRRAAFNVLDLIQEGNVGLMHAVRKYDPFKGVKLSTYAAWWIRAYILRFIMDNWRMVKLGTTQAQRKLFFNLRKEQRRLANEGFTVGPKLLAERLGVSEEEVQEMDLRLSGDEVWIDTPVSEESDTPFGESLAAAGRPADENLGDEQLQQLLRKKLETFAEKLEGRERYIFEKRMMAEEPLTLQQIGDHFGFSRERARQIEARLLKQIREELRASMPDFETLLPDGE